MDNEGIFFFESTLFEEALITPFVMQKINADIYGGRPLFKIALNISSI